MIRTPVALLLNTPIAISSAMIAASVSAVVSPGTATMSSPTEPNALMLSRRSLAARMNRARQPAHRRRRHPAALLDGVGQHCQRGDRAGRARLLDPHRLQ